MEYRTLPNTGLKVSRVSFGTMTFGSQADEESARRMIDLCLDAGINFIDTANIYNKGLSETIVGKLLKGRRDKVVLATKVRGKMGDAPDESGLSRAAIQKAIDASLQRLQTDYVDLYYLHQPDYDAPIEETLAAMDELVNLRFGSGAHGGMSVARVDDRDAREAVDILLAAGVGDARAVSAVDDDRLDVGEAGGDEARVLLARIQIGHG